MSGGELGYAFSQVSAVMVQLADALAGRLALCHNQISTFPDKFAECSRLRYLNIRSNLIREFPLAVRLFYGSLDQKAPLTPSRCRFAKYLSSIFWTLAEINCEFCHLRSQISRH